MTVQVQAPPVPIEVQHETLRFVERTVMGQLGNSDHPWMPVGTRLAFWLADENGDPTGREYRHECGFLDPLDEATAVEVDENEWKALIEEYSDVDPLPISFVDELHQQVKAKLEAGANQRLVVGVAGVLTGSVSCWGVGCWCSGRKGYYRRCRLVCTGTPC